MYNNYTEYREAWAKAETETPPVPLNIDLELASTCNLRCPFCFIPDPKFETFISQKADDGKPLRRLMPKDVAFKIIDEAFQIGVPALKFNWRGESTLHPHYSEIVEYARLKKRKIYPEDPRDPLASIEVRGFIELLANTNANCSGKSLGGLMATTKCMISLDSMVPETYVQMRVGGDLEKAKDTITTLAELGHPNLWVRRVLSKANQGEDFFALVKAQWGDAVKVSEHHCFDRNEKQSHEISGCDHDEFQHRRYCVYPSQRLVITSAGMAYPCCIDLHETMPVGDTRKQGLLEIWNGKPMQELRENLKTKNVKAWSETCRNCQSWMSYDAPQRNFVQDVELQKGGIA